MNTKHCRTCAAEFTCKTEQGADSCWCMRYPAVMAVENGQHCCCPDCLAKLASESISKRLQTLPLEAAVTLASRYRTDSALIEHIDYTLDAGNLVFSRWYHLKRGSCCGNGCRHCPYT